MPAFTVKVLAEVFELGTLKVVKAIALWPFEEPIFKVMARVSLTAVVPVVSATIDKTLVVPAVTVKFTVVVTVLGVPPAVKVVLVVPTWVPSTKILEFFKVSVTVEASAE